MPLGGEFDPEQATVVQMRARQCDYYDGEIVAGAPFADLGFAGELAAFSWYVQNFVPGWGRAVVGTAAQQRDDHREFSLCTAEVPQIDASLCEDCESVGDVDLDPSFIHIFEDVWRVEPTTGAATLTERRRVVRATDIRTADLP